MMILLKRLPGWSDKRQVYGGSDWEGYVKDPTGLLDDHGSVSFRLAAHWPDHGCCSRSWKRKHTTMMRMATTTTVFWWDDDDGFLVGRRQQRFLLVFCLVNPTIPTDQERHSEVLYLHHRVLYNSTSEKKSSWFESRPLLRLVVVGGGIEDDAMIILMVTTDSSEFERLRRE
jgi:hypothetical protein